jgi:transcriptional regulator with XRE-family HTH domain
MGAPDRQNPKTKGLFRRPQTLGEHLKKRRRQLGLLQREADERMGISTGTYTNWEKGKTQPVAAQFRPIVTFLGYDPTPEPTTLAERLEAKRRTLGVTFDQVAKVSQMGSGHLDPLPQRHMAHPTKPDGSTRTPIVGREY